MAVVTQVAFDEQDPVGWFDASLNGYWFDGEFFTIFGSDASLDLSATGGVAPLVAGTGALALSADGSGRPVVSASAALALTAVGTAGHVPQVMNLIVTVVSTSELDLSWDAVPSAFWYEIERDGVSLTTTSVTSYADTGLSPGTSHTYRVRAAG